MDLVERISSFISVECLSIHCSGARHRSTPISTLHSSKLGRVCERAFTIQLFTMTVFTALTCSIPTNWKWKLRWYERSHRALLGRVVTHVPKDSENLLCRYENEIDPEEGQQHRLHVDTFSFHRHHHVALIFPYRIYSRLSVWYFALVDPTQFLQYVLCIIRDSNRERWESSEDPHRKISEKQSRQWASIHPTELRSY